MKKNATNPYGFLLITKPEGLTSHDIVHMVRKTLGIKAVGHTGTLDPFATGVLLILLGSATRLAEYTNELPKTYTAELTLGASSDTQDLTGITTSSQSSYQPALKEIKTSIQSFIGTISQIPPIYSAIKYQGKKLYELARGNEIEKAKKAAGERRREITVYDIQIHSYTYPKLTMTITCSSGTYIRTLAHDIGASLQGIGAYVSVLTRDAIGNFTNNDAISPSASKEELLEAVQPVELLIEHVPQLKLDPTSVAQLQEGKALKIREIFTKNSAVAIKNETNDSLVGIGSYDPDTSLLHPKKIFLP